MSKLTWKTQLVAKKPILTQNQEIYGIKKIYKTCKKLEKGFFQSTLLKLKLILKTFSIGIRTKW